MSDRLWGWTRFLRASGASEQRSQFPSYTYTICCLAYISSYYLILWAISDLTLHCTIWKYYYLCKTIDKMYTFISRQFDKEFRLLGLLRKLQWPYVPNRQFVTQHYASLGHCASSKIRAYPKPYPSCVRYSIWRSIISNLKAYRFGCEDGLDLYERAERDNNDHSFQAVNIHYIALHIFPVCT